MMNLKKKREIQLVQVTLYTQENYNMREELSCRINKVRKFQSIENTKVSC